MLQAVATNVKYASENAFHSCSWSQKSAMLGRRPRSRWKYRPQPTPLPAGNSELAHGLLLMAPIFVCRAAEPKDVVFNTSNLLSDLRC